MALPNQIDPASPPGSEDISLGDDRIRALKQAIIDIFGLPSATNIAAALFAADGTGLLQAFFQDKAADPAAVGQLQRNAGVLYWHDGNRVYQVAPRPITLIGQLANTANLPNAAIITNTALGVVGEAWTFIVYQQTPAEYAEWTVPVQRVTKVRLLWSSLVTSGNMRWNMEIREKGSGDLLAGTPVFAIGGPYTAAAPGSAGQIVDTLIALSTPYVPTAGKSTMLFRIWRNKPIDASDTLAGDVGLVSAELIP